MWKYGDWWGKSKAKVCESTCISLLNFLCLWHYILKETYNAKSELALLEWTLHLCLRFVLYHMRLVNTFIISMYGIVNYLLIMPKLVSFYAKQQNIQKMEFHFGLKVSFSIHTASTFYSWSCHRYMLLTCDNKLSLKLYELLCNL